MLGEEMVEKFLDRVCANSVHPGICKDSGLEVVYTPLNGTGKVPMIKLLKRKEKLFGRYSLLGFQALKKATVQVAREAQMNNYKVPYWVNLSKRRGAKFERLLYEVFERENILLERSYFNDDGSQQIDGAVEVPVALTIAFSENYGIMVRVI